MKKSEFVLSVAAQTQMKLAVAWQAKGKFAQALASYETAIKLQPDYTEIYFQLMRLLVQMGQEAQAVNTYYRAMDRQAQKGWLSSPDEDKRRENFLDSDVFIAGARRDYREAIERRSYRGEPMRILLYTNCPGTYGAEQVSHALAVQLTQSGYKVIYVQSKADHYLIDERTKLGIEHIWLEDDAHYVPYSATNVLEVARIFSTVMPDLIIFADGTPTDNLAANWLAMYLNLPYIRIIHCIIPYWATLYESHLDLLPPIYKSARAVVSVSVANLRQLREKFKMPEDKGLVIYNGRPDKYFAPPSLEVRHRLRQTLGIPPDAVVVFTAARIEKVKGYQHQVSAIARLRHKPIWSELYFVWAGGGTQEPKLKDDIEELGVREQVKFLGERADIPDLLEAADIFLLPSHFEGMPLAIMEAMAKGLPVIATAISGIPEELGDTGQLLPDPNIDPGATVEGIVETIEAWARDEELRRSVGRGCQQKAALLFREERMLDNYLKLIREVMP